ncbi:MAG: hypothetical protein ACI9HK_001479 [Pirellulaceae bacterium]
MSSSDGNQKNARCGIQDHIADSKDEQEDYPAHHASTIIIVHFSPIKLNETS